MSSPEAHKPWKVDAVVPPSEGWAWPAGAHSCHFFVEGKSLCAAHEFTGNLQADNGREETVDCGACAKNMEKRR